MSCIDWWVCASQCPSHLVLRDTRYLWVDCLKPPNVFLGQWNVYGWGVKGVLAKWTCAEDGRKEKEKQLAVPDGILFWSRSCSQEERKEWVSGKEEGRKEGWRGGERMKGEGNGGGEWKKWEVGRRGRSEGGASPTLEKVGGKEKRATYLYTYDGVKSQLVGIGGKLAVYIGRPQDLSPTNRHAGISCVGVVTGDISGRGRSINTRISGFDRA